MVYAPSACREIGREFPDCSVCRKPGREAQRAAWGCDEPAVEPVFGVTCSSCGGDGCAECGDTGSITFNTCPRLALRARPDILDTMRAYQTFNERHVLPEAGGTRDQPSAMLRAFDLIDDERAAIERERDNYRLQAATAAKGPKR